QEASVLGTEGSRFESGAGYDPARSLLEDGESGRFPRPHTVEVVMTRHEHMTCSQCGKVFYGENAFDAHRECGKVSIRGKYRLHVNERTGVALYVLKGDWAHFEEMRARAAKAREGKRK